MKSGSACVVVLLRCDALGAAIALGKDMPKSIRLMRICSAVVMIEAPPGEPIARKGLPSRSTIVGDMLDRGRLPGAGRFGSGAVPCVGAKLKSVSSLLSRNPRPGTTIPLPPSCSIVFVYDTRSPHRSLTTKWLVCVPSLPGLVSAVANEHVGEPFRSPGATGLVSACVGSIRQA